MAFEPIEPNDIDLLGAETLKTIVTVYAVSIGSPIALRFTSFEAEGNPTGLPQVRVNMEIYNINTLSIIKTWSVTADAHAGNLSANVFTQIHIKLQEKLRE